MRLAAPASHAIGTAGEIAFLEGQYPTVAIGIGDTKSCMEHQLVVVAFIQPMDEVDIGFNILGKGNVEYLILPKTVL